MRMSEPKQNLLDDKTEELLEVAFWEHDMEGKLKGDLCRSNRDAFKSQVRKVIRTLTPLNALAAEARSEERRRLWMVRARRITWRRLPEPRA